jgi:hypothetical protein
LALGQLFQPKRGDDQLFRFQQGNELGKGIARNKPIQGVKQRHGSLSYGCARGAVKPAICETGCSQNRFYFPISLYNNKGRFVKHSQRCVENLTLGSMFPLGVPCL